jgi:hypothetical protein
MSCLFSVVESSSCVWKHKRNLLYWWLYDGLPKPLGGSTIDLSDTPDTLKTFCWCLMLESSTLSPQSYCKTFDHNEYVELRDFLPLSSRLVLAHLQLVMSSVSHVQQEYKHEVQQHNSRFASGLTTSDIMSRQCKKLSGCKILSSTWQTWERVSRIKPEEMINYDKVTAARRSFLFLTGFFHPIGQCW